jgi:DUF4097 and DUF4098 domain-containing protein YvlB
MRRFMKTAAGAALTIVGCVSPATAQSDFAWHGPVATGQSIEIKGINGDVRAALANTNEVEVTATRTARRSNPADVRLEVVPHAGGVTICAVYPDVPGREPNRCEPGSEGRSQTRDNDTVVHFLVRVPNGVRFIGRTVNGEVEGSALQGNAEGHTVNGSVRLSTTGSALASTVNGSINASMAEADWSDGASFKTVNGGITLTLPSFLNAELRAETVNGGITTDFPITATGQFSRRRLRGTIGSGGRELVLSTVNGSIKLLRAQ